MTQRGADFSDLQPRDDRGILANLPFVTIPPLSGGIETGTIFQATPNNAFRLGQQVIFWLGVANPPDAQDGNYMTELRLKPWWARNNMEYRQAGARNGSYQSAAAYLPIDQQVFEGTALANNRYVWVPGQKRLDVTEYDSPPPTAALPRTSDSLMLEDVWKIQLEDPTDATYAANFQTGQIPSRWLPIFYPAQGYALGFTWEAEYESAQGSTPSPQIISAEPIRIRPSTGCRATP
jgi:hypothetical protein